MRLNTDAGKKLLPEFYRTIAETTCTKNALPRWEGSKTPQPETAFLLELDQCVARASWANLNKFLWLVADKQVFTDDVTEAINLAKRVIASIFNVDDSDRIRNRMALRFWPVEPREEIEMANVKFGKNKAAAAEPVKTKGFKKNPPIKDEAEAAPKKAAKSAPTAKKANGEGRPELTIGKVTLRGHSRVTAATMMKRKGGTTVEEICKALGIVPASVGTIVAKFKEFGIDVQRPSAGHLLIK